MRVRASRTSGSKISLLIWQGGKKARRDRKEQARGAHGILAFEARRAGEMGKEDGLKNNGRLRTFSDDRDSNVAIVKFEVRELPRSPTYVAMNFFFARML